LSRHEHEFTALWWHFGPHGNQDVHLHSCFTQGCSRVLVGDGRECDGKSESHREVRLTQAGMVPAK